MRNDRCKEAHHCKSYIADHCQGCGNNKIEQIDTADHGIRTAHCPFMNSCEFYPKGECGGCNYYTPYVHSDPVINKKVEEFKKYVKYDMDSYAQLVSSLNKKGGMTMHYCDYSKFSVSPSGSAIKDVIFNDPATIVYWTDGTKTVVKAQNGEYYDPEKGLAMAITKKALGNQGNYFETIKKWVKKYVESELTCEMLADGLVFYKNGKPYVTYDENGLRRVDKEKKE